jgi:hypothetical protein
VKFEDQVIEARSGPKQLCDCRKRGVVILRLVVDVEFCADGEGVEVWD